MSLIETVSDVNNAFLSRRELTCNFAGLGGKLKKLEVIDMITKEFKLDGKIIIPIKLHNHVGKPMITGIFYVYDDEKLAKEHVNPVIFARLEKAKKPVEEKEKKPEDVKPEVSEDKKEEPKKQEEKVEKPKEKSSEKKPNDAKVEDKKVDAKAEEKKKEKSE